MPLRDHFHSPLDDRHSWDALHGGWPMVIVMDLSRILPPQYVANPRVVLGTVAEIDVATIEKPDLGSVSGATEAGGGGVATAAWAPPKPTFGAAADLPGQDEYEVRIYDTKRDRRLVAAIEIVSPSNKDRPETRGASVAKCADLIRQRVSVALVDVVTTRHFNLYSELLEVLGHEDPAMTADSPSIYVAACRFIGRRGNGRIESWAHPLAIGRPLPTLPLWLADNYAVPLDLEGTYEETCRALRIS